MSNPFERRLLIGDQDFSNFEEAGSKKTEEVKQSRTEQFIFPDAQERFNNTLEAIGFEPMSELENGIKYPSLNEWVGIQIEQYGAKGLRFYPTFVQDKKSHQTLFCKARIVPSVEFGGLQAEAEILSQLPEHAPAPQLIKYLPEEEQSNHLELLIIEAVKFSEGSVLPLPEWTAEHSKNVIAAVKQLEEIPMETLPNLPQIPSVTIESVLERASEIIKPEFQQMIAETLEEYKPHSQPVLTHGDTWLRNIIIGSDTNKPKITFVDWERGGAGYRGQDAARSWWDLWDNNTAREGLVESYINKPDIANLPARQTQLKFGVVFEALRWLADRNEILKDNNKSQNHGQVLLEIGPIHKKAKEMLERISKTDI